MKASRVSMTCLDLLLVASMPKNILVTLDLRKVMTSKESDERCVRSTSDDVRSELEDSAKDLEKMQRW